MHQAEANRLQRSQLQRQQCLLAVLSRQQQGRCLTLHALCIVSIVTNTCPNGWCLLCREPLSITVAATDSSDQRLWLSPGKASNYGKCVHVWAPGAHIVSADNDSDSATAYRSGTSQAVPFVAGAIALYLQNASGTP